MSAIEVVIRDLYKTGQDTIILEGKAAERYSKSADKSRFLASLETVDFDKPYVISAKKV